MQEKNMVFVMYYCYKKRAGALQISHKILFLLYVTYVILIAVMCAFTIKYQIASKINAFYYDNIGDIHNAAFNLFHNILLSIYDYNIEQHPSCYYCYSTSMMITIFLENGRKNTKPEISHG